MVEMIDMGQHYKRDMLLQNQTENLNIANMSKLTTYIQIRSINKFKQE